VEVGREHSITLRLGIDQHVGGSGDLPNPGDLLCAALAACEDGTIRMIANLLGVTLMALEVEVQGTVDVRGCLGVDPHAQVGFTGFWSTVRLQPAADTPPRLIDKLIETTKRVCVNLDTLRRPNPIELIVDPPSTR
jgi:uncharacterized OsmC-like protein